MNYSFLLFKQQIIPTISFVHSFTISGTLRLALSLSNAPEAPPVPNDFAKIEWGDGHKEKLHYDAILVNGLTHQYAQAGNYEINVTMLRVIDWAVTEEGDETYTQITETASGMYLSLIVP